MQHPTELITQFIKTNGLSEAQLAMSLRISPQRLNNLLNGKRRISAEMALRLARFFGNTPEFWLAAQFYYDLADALAKLGPGIELEVQPLTQRQFQPLNKIQPLTSIHRETKSEQEADVKSNNGEATQSNAKSDNGEATQSNVKSDNGEATQSNVKSDNGEATQSNAKSDNGEATAQSAMREEAGNQCENEESLEKKLESMNCQIGPEQDVYKMIALAKKPIHFDHLCHFLNLTPGTLSAALTVLEFADYIVRSSGDWYSLPQPHPPKEDRRRKRGRRQAGE